MKSIFFKGVILSFVITFLFSCGSKKEESNTASGDNEQIKKEIQERENEFANIFNTREMKAIGYYAEDAISYSQNKPPLVGKEAIVSYYKSNMDSLPASYQITFTTNEVFPSNGGNQVIEIGYYKMIDSSNNTTVNSGNYMSIFEKRNGKYVSIRDMSTSDLSLD